MAIRIETGRAESGATRLRAVDAAGTALAAAIDVGGRWIVWTYQSGSPIGEISARLEADAREWVQWLGEQADDAARRCLT